jgi:hypothetical protein
MQLHHKAPWLVAAVLRACKKSRCVHIPSHIIAWAPAADEEFALGKKEGFKNGRVMGLMQALTTAMADKLVRATGCQS